MKRPAALLAVALLLLSFALISYRIIWLRYPLFPPAPEKAWKLDMEARLTAHQKEVNVKIGFPFTHGEQIVVEERITSGRLTFNLLREGPNQVGVWSGDVGPEEEVISYRATILMTPQRSSKTKTRAFEPYPATLGMADGWRFSFCSGPPVSRPVPSRGFLSSKT